MYRFRRQFFFPALAVISCFATACSSTSVSSQPAAGYSGAGFKNFLVIGVANDFEGRATFEHKLVSELRSMGANATALYVVGGGNTPIERSAIEMLVKENGYDAVLISRVLNRDTEASIKTGSADAKAVRKDGRPVNLFRYDYEELNEPPSLDFNLSVRLSTELFSAESSEKVWAIESDISAKDGLPSLVLEAVETITRQLKKNKLVAG